MTALPLIYTCVWVLAPSVLSCQRLSMRRWLAPSLGRPNFSFILATIAFVKLFLTRVRTLQMPQGELLVNDSSRPLGSEHLLVVICQFPEPFDPAMSLTIVAARRPPTGAATTIFLVGAMLTGAPSNCRPNTAMTKWLCPRLSSRTTSDFALASGWP